MGKRELRIMYSDPYATESSSDEKDAKRVKLDKKVIHHLIMDGDNSAQSDEKKTLKKAGGKIKNYSKREKKVVKREDKKTKGIRLRKWGRWAAEIRNPIEKTRHWLGTFDTAEEAQDAYEAKKAEFDARRAEMKVNNKEPNEKKGTEEKTIAITN